MKRFLITTADERTWRTDRPILFLGEWCRLYDRRAQWESLDAEVMPYHWDDRHRYDEDYGRLQGIYEVVLPALAAALNEQHGSSQSLRFWRALVGPWLYHYLHTVFDRWTLVRLASEVYDIEDTVIYDAEPPRLIATDLVDFAGARVQDVLWNHHIFGRAVQHIGRIPWRSMPAPELPASASNARSRPAWRRVRTTIRGAVRSCLAQVTRADEAMVIRSHLPMLTDLRLQLALGQVPKLWDPPGVPAVPPDMSRRRGMRLRMKDPDEFVRFAATLLPEQIPTVFLEGYEALNEAAARLPWPSRPRVIFTSNLYHFCEPFQLWAARKAEAGAPFVIGQHGGFVGLAKRHPGIDHQLQLCDRYLSWGWSDAGGLVCPTGVLTNIGKPRTRLNTSGNLLLVTTPIQLYAFRVTSWPVGANQSAAFAAEQVRFGGALPPSIRRTLTVRIIEADDRKWRTGYVQRWTDALPGVRIDPSTEPIEGALQRCRLFVYTYNSSGFLETLARNIPTVVFWNPQYFDVRHEAQSALDLLADARIYHTTPESAARHVSEIWESVAEWWNAPDVQRARREFCDRYARTPVNPLKAVLDALVTVREPALASS